MVDLGFINEHRHSGASSSTSFVVGRWARTVWASSSASFVGRWARTVWASWTASCSPVAVGPTVLLCIRRVLVFGCKLLAVLILDSDERPTSDTMGVAVPLLCHAFMQRVGQGFSVLLALLSVVVAVNDRLWSGWPLHRLFDVQVSIVLVGKCSGCVPVQHSSTVASYLFVSKLRGDVSVAGITF